jgi:hypothetical protein
MTRRTVRTVAAVTSVAAVVALVATLWWGGGPSTAKTLALVGAVVIATVSLVVLFVVSKRARPIGHESVGLPHTTRPDVEFRDRGDRFGPP